MELMDTMKQGVNFKNGHTDLLHAICLMAQMQPRTCFPKKFNRIRGAKNKENEEAKFLKLGRDIWYYRSLIAHMRIDNELLRTASKNCIAQFMVETNEERRYWK